MSDIIVYADEIVDIQDDVHYTEMYNELSMDKKTESNKIGRPVIRGSSVQGGTANEELEGRQEVYCFVRKYSAVVFNFSSCCRYRNIQGENKLSPVLHGGIRGSSPN